MHFRNKASFLLSTLLLCFAPLASLFAQPKAPQQIQQQWGDQLNGTYINPILPADYSDPDVIRVGEKYYMVASDFHFIGMQILESDDMVNWRVVTQVYDRFDYPGWDTNKHYAGGSWAPALRYQEGRFYIYFCTPDEGLFMTSAPEAAGPWEPLHLVRQVPKWEDPCPFWDDEIVHEADSTRVIPGQAYLVRSRHGAGPIIVHKMSRDGKQLLDEGVTVYEGPVAEGPKFLKRNGYYYISIPEGGVERGWQTVLRSKDIYGPYESRRVLETGSTSINGPHQGSIVDTPDGTWWFYHFQHAGAIGRIVHLQPMTWQDDWPVIGVDYDGNGVGEPVNTWAMPIKDKPIDHAAHLPYQDISFKPEGLSPLWQWNHNPDNTAWSLTEHPGALTLHALQSDNFANARNTITMRTMGYDIDADIVLDVSNLADGGRAGLACIGRSNELLGVLREGDTFYLYRNIPQPREVFLNGRTRTIFDEKESRLQELPITLDTTIIPSPPPPPKALSSSGTTLLCPPRAKICFSIHFDLRTQSYHFSYSLDGEIFDPVGDPFFVDYGNWKGVRWGIYHYNVLGPSGSVTAEKYQWPIYP